MTVLVFVQVGVVAFPIGLAVTFGLAAATGGKDSVGYSSAFVLLGWPLLLLTGAALDPGASWGT